MKKLIQLLIIFFACINSFAQSKTIPFKSGSVKTNENILKSKFFNRYQKSISYRHNIYALVQLDKAPDAATIKSLKAKGIKLQHYVSSNTYLAELPQQTLKAIPTGISGVYHIPEEIKIDKNLAEEPAITDPNTFVAVMFFGSITKEEVKKEIANAGATISTQKIDPDNTVFVNASPDVIQKIAALPFVMYVGKQTLKDVPLNYVNRAAHSLDALNNIGGRNLQGKGVTVGVGDDANPNTHVDFGTRLIVRTPATSNYHGTHVTGSVGGAGLIDPQYKGMAPKATIINQYFSEIIVSTPVYIHDNQLVLTNNSYYSGADYCPGDGAYDILSNYTDVQLNTYPNILHVFASGNDGGLTCSPYPAGFGNIKSGFQCSKNVLTVGNINNTGTSLINPGSSKGPVRDGRIKPEIVAGGTGVWSTTPGNGYGTNTGTSMASPTVTGTLALLYERYRQLHGGADPEGAFIKAIICNTAEDKGNPGPDFSYGFGMFNARRAVEAIENNTYFTNTITNGDEQSQTLTIPAGAQVKVMLYWSDPDAIPNAAKALINDLDLTVTDGASTVHYPLILNPANATAEAVEGIDNLNNIEQVTINNATAGNYTVKVKGTNISTGSQKYYVVYQILPPSITVEYPFGNEIFLPGSTEKIRWSYYGNDVNTFSVDYSIDNGGTWINIRNNVRADSNLVAWTVPSLATSQALIRVSRNNTALSDQSDFNFTILNQPNITLTSLCPGYVRISWASIASATSYNVLKLVGDSMHTIATIPQATGTIHYNLALSKDSTYFLSVEPIMNDVKGRRAYARSINANGGDCSDALLDNNFALEAIVSPITGRQFTSSALTSTTPVTVRLRNGDNIASTGDYEISYQVNDGTVTTEISSASIPAKSTLDYSFPIIYDFSDPKAYTIKAWVKHIGDARTDDDTLSTVVKQLANAPITLSTPFTEDFENADDQTYTAKTVGLAGLDRGDFNTNSTQGRARTFVNTGFARSGSKCITLDKSILTASSASDSLTLTFNLSNYSLTHQIWLDLFYKNHGIDFTLPGNKIWIRGGDTYPWIEVYTLPAKVEDFGVYKAIKSINITEVLQGASQTMTSSFQVRIGEQGYTSANSVIPAGNIDDGFSFDDVTISMPSNDVGMKSLVAPITSNVCGLGSSEPISVLLKNYSATTFTHVPITYSVNGTTITEYIETLEPGDFTYTFDQKADFSSYREYKLKAWVKNTSDNYANNDTLPEITFHTVPLISNYPYMEGFENSNGDWYSEGFNNTWEWGAPAKPVINKAANGANVWTTGLTNGYKNNELSYLYSPCFDVSSLAKPMLSFSHITDLEACDCDAHWLEYSTDGNTWIKLGTAGTGVNWYNNSAKNVWQTSMRKWHVASYELPTGYSKLRLRFVMNSDPASSFDGIGIDDIHIFDKVEIYAGADISSGIARTVNGNDWIEFTDASGKRVAALNANGQDLGNTLVKVFFNPTTPVRFINNQYYLDRNIVVQPATAPSDSVSVRFYFLNREALKLMNATGCGTCNTIPDPYESGVTQYSSNASEEDGTWSNNNTGNSKFIEPHSRVKIIPYDSGYYAEYKVKEFSEFWINSGGPDQNVPLPLTLLSFTVTQKNTQGILKWQTEKEVNTLKFVIEKSTDGIRYNSIGEVAAHNSLSINNYNYIDSNLVNGQNYYRLKMIDINGQFTYSPVRSITYNIKDFDIKIYPNPVVGNRVFITTSSNCLRLELKDAAGKQLKTISASGKQNELNVSGLTKGIYVLIITTDAGVKIEKVLIN